MDNTSFSETIRLVIWDLDETFWHGTLEEGPVHIPAAHREIVSTLARRGIISSICSKNAFEPTKQRLEAEGLWSWFVFPMIDYNFKSTLIATTIEQMGLRAETILFIDDNPFNRGEVAERIPGINVCSEAFIPHLLSHPQLRGKDDHELIRLERYRLLEMKQTEIKTSENPKDFLRDCQIEVSFHFDVLTEFSRIHELVNRTNQLNFTKVRWNEDLETARHVFEESSKRQFNVHNGYIKVRDKFGYYGICGFFETIGYPTQAKHFLFSCRVLNMGVEQFVFQKLKFPWIKLEPPFAAKLERQQVVDWISVVDDAEEASDRYGTPSNQSPLTMCLHGPCELVQSAHYLRPLYNIVEEFQFPKLGWGIQRPLIRYIGLAEEFADLGIVSCAGLGLSENFGNLDFSALNSTVFSKNVDVGLFSFSLESEISIYKHRNTGLLIPLSIGKFDRKDITTLPADDLKAANANLSLEHIQEMQDNFEFHSRFDLDVFTSDLSKLKTKFKFLKKPIIIIEGFDDVSKIDLQKYHDNGIINRLARNQLGSLGNIHFVRVSDYVKSRAQQVEINHFQREVYVQVADQVKALLAKLDMLLV